MVAAILSSSARTSGEPAAVPAFGGDSLVTRSRSLTPRSLHVDGDLERLLLDDAVGVAADAQVERAPDGDLAGLGGDEGDSERALLLLEAAVGPRQDRLGEG